jgi:hypothetical protein
MDEFRTAVSPIISPVRIGRKDSILTLGSCFSDAIGRRLEDSKFQVAVNPFGTIYNPLSLHDLMILATDPPAALSDETFVLQSDVHLNYLMHSDFSALDRETLDTRIRQAFHSVQVQLKSCRFILITYGTAFVYTHRETGRVVANCHKQPAQLFNKSLLTADDILKSFDRLRAMLHRINPDINIILTVSPVRHIKDSLLLNSVSKAVLRTSCHYLQEKFPNVTYFPSFEIVMDELRDYRFYASDMIHPSAQAEDYIWQRFQESYFDSSTITFVNEWKKIRAALQHRPFHPASVGHQNFLQQLLKKLEGLKTSVDVELEIQFVKDQLLQNSNASNHDHRT